MLNKQIRSCVVNVHVKFALLSD